MGFAFGAKSQTNSQTGNPIILSHTTISNTKLLVVGIITKTTTQRTGGAPTFNGVALTQVGSTMVGSAECTAELWYLSNPFIGTANVSVPNSGALTITVIASSYTDATVDGAVLDTYNSTNVTQSNPSLSVTTGANGEAIVDIFGSGYTSIGTGNKTLLYRTDEGIWTTHAQYELQATAGLTTFTWTQPSDDVAFIVGAFKGVTATPKSFSDTGNGADAFINPFRAMGFGESGHGTEAFINPYRAMSFADAGLGTDAFTNPFRAMGFLDSGQGIDVFTLISMLFFSDTGLGTEAFQKEILPEIIEKYFNDVGSGADLFAIIFKDIGFSDSATGVDVFQIIFKSLGFVDYGNGIDSFSMTFRLVQFNEVGLGTDVFSTPFRAMSFSETGHGEDKFALFLNVFFTDTGHGAEVFTQEIPIKPKVEDRPPSMQPTMVVNVR